jgi:uncharacterized protein with von Willebrand factor type A (vWA) domain
MLELNPSTKGNIMQHDFILLDRSGSMSNLWIEALNSINAYVKKLADDNVDTGVTVAAFDTGSQGLIDFEILRDKITPKTFKMLSNADALPRGMTPLSDASCRIVHLAKSGTYDKVAIIIMTDGHENASKEFTVKQAKDLLEECRSKGWQIIFLGANFDNAHQSMSYGNAAHSTINSSVANLSQTMSATASLRSAYATTGAAMVFTDEQKKKAAGIEPLK